MKNSRLNFFVLLALPFVASCGPGFFLGESALSGLPAQRLAVHLNSSFIRKNVCIAFQLQALDGFGSVTANVNAAVTLQASLSAKIYPTLASCQKHDSAFESLVYFLDSTAPSKTLYVRPEDTGELQILASASEYGLAQSVDRASVSFASYARDLRAEGPNSSVTVVIRDPSSGKYYLGGFFTSFGGFKSPGVVRLNADSSVDTSFQVPGVGFDGDAIETLALQSDGKLLVGGWFNSVSGTSRRNLTRLNTDGSVDTSFAESTASGPIYKIIVLSDDKFYASGTLIIYGPTFTSVRWLVRVNADGTLDSTFSQTGLGINIGPVTDMVLQPDDRLVIVGVFSTYNISTSRNKIMRLLPTGALDTSFNPGTGLTNTPWSVCLQADGKLIVTGDITAYRGVTRNGVVRINSDGTLDSGFVLDGAGFDAQVHHCALQPDGKVLASGSFQNYGGNPHSRLARLNTDGSLDTSFSLAGSSFSNNLWGSFVQPDSSVLAYGYFTGFNGTTASRLLKLTSTGAIASDFPTLNAGFETARITGLALEDGRVLIGGNFTEYNGLSAGRIALLDEQGALDASFAPVGAGFDGNVVVLKEAPQGKFLVGGQFTSYGGATVGNLARLNTDGTLDTGFSAAGVGFTGGVISLALQEDGKILVGGSFSQFNGAPVDNVVRLHSDGSLDATFATAGVGLNANVYALALTPEGKVYVGGNFVTYNGGAAAPYIVRLNSDGSHDTAFAPVGAGLNGQVRAITVLEDGDIFAVGWFSSYNSDATARQAVRINADGSRDPSFALSSSLVLNGPYSVERDPDGKLLLTAESITKDGENNGVFIRLLENGELDPIFAPPAGGLAGNFAVKAYSLPDRRILVFGELSSIGEQPVPSAVRLTYTGQLD